MFIREASDLIRETLPSFKNRLAKINYSGPIPDEYRCPISGEIMDDPITASNGVTYDRGSLIKWFEDNSYPAFIACPKSSDVIYSSVLDNKTCSLIKEELESFVRQQEIASKQLQGKNTPVLLCNESEEQHSKATTLGLTQFSPKSRARAATSSSTTHRRSARLAKKNM